MKPYVKSSVSGFNYNTLTQMFSLVFVIPLVSNLLSFKKMSFFKMHGKR